VRPAEVFVRALEASEARKLKRLATDGKHRSTRIRAMILLASATEMPAPQIAQLYLTDAEYVRKVIHDFNHRGFGALDPDYRGGGPKKVTPARDVLGFLQTIRMRYPARRRIHLVMDNLSTHWTNDIRDWAHNSNVQLVATPTYASFLNRIECHFWAIGEFVIKNADYPDWDTLAKAMADYIQLRNRTHGGGPIAQIEARRRVA
jgi:transposase